jgi:glycosyltransferase involved in cell wall biosynthesis
MNLRASVCMAVYNGATFLKQQVESILAQLRPQDELIAVDDGSRDDSVRILCEVHDPRLRVHRNESNLGAMPSFERALNMAAGEIVFLSDQDDLWLPGKVAKALDVFASEPQVTMVVTDARVIDEEGRTLNESFFSVRGRFAGGLVRNFVKNKYLGCTLSFRRTMLEKFLPIPQDVPMHDIWFGLLNEIYGRTFFIDEPLTAYRRHRRNASPIVHTGPAQILRWRYRLAKNIVRRVAGLRV